VLKALDTFVGCESRSDYGSEFKRDIASFRGAKILQNLKKTKKIHQYDVIGGYGYNIIYSNDYLVK